MALEPGDPRPGTPEFMARLIRTVRPFRRGEEVVTRGRERAPLLVVRPPAYATATFHLVRLVGDLSRQRDMATRWPEAFRVQYSDELKVMVWTPVERYDPEDLELIPVRWSAGGRRMVVNLLEILQPRRLTVPPGMAMEIPVMAAELEGQGTVLLCLLGQHRIRPVRGREPAAPAAGPAAGPDPEAAEREPPAGPAAAGAEPPPAPISGRPAGTGPRPR